jgi:hypothetical protein
MGKRLGSAVVKDDKFLMTVGKEVGTMERHLLPSSLWNSCWMIMIPNQERVKVTMSSKGVHVEFHRGGKKIASLENAKSGYWTWEMEVFVL